MSNSMSLRETHHASHSYLTACYLIAYYLITYYLTTYYLTTYYLTTYYLTTKLHVFRLSSRTGDCLLTPQE